MSSDVLIRADAKTVTIDSSTAFAYNIKTVMFFLQNLKTITFWYRKINIFNRSNFLSI